VNEYLNIVRSRTLLEAVASSLTELFSRDLITLRMEKLRQHYPWLSGGLDYFEARLTQAPEDAQFAVTFVHENAKTRAQQELAILALRDKCDILWAQLDALYFAYVEPGCPPPGAFRIQEKRIQQKEDA
jgi:pyrroloquinoline-quinone synthase